MTIRHEPATAKDLPQMVALLGQLFEQNAIVFCEVGHAPDLIILEKT